MEYQSIFKRYELKYLLTVEEKERLLGEVSDMLEPDKYAHSSIQNLYYDNSTYRLIRRSIEKPDYKEKIRIRRYVKADRDDTVFVELKKKYESVVYKRRIALPEAQAYQWLSGESVLPIRTQITDEIDYFIFYYGPLRPAMYISYERDSYYSPSEKGFRLTFDTEIKATRDAKTLDTYSDGFSLLPNGKVLMEIKCNGGIPLWLVERLSRMKIYKTSFSKYGTAYANLIFNEHIKQGDFSNV